MIMAYIGNDDFRGYLAARASGPGGMDANARAALGAQVGNDGGYDPNLLNSYYDSPTENRAGERDALVGWTQNEYNNWLNRNGSTLGLNNLSTNSNNSGTAQPAYDPNDLALIDDQVNTANSAIARLLGQRQIGNENIDNSYNEAENSRQSQFGLAQRDYTTKKTDDERDYATTRAGIRQGAGNQYSSLQRLLGSAGAGRSTAATVLAPFAVGRQAASRFGETQDQFGRNQRNQDTAWGDTTRGYDEQGQQLVSQRDQKRRELEQGLQSNEVGLQDQIAQLRLQREQLTGGNLQNAFGAIQPQRSRIQELLGSIDNLGRQYSSAVKQTGPVQYKAPELDQYNYSRFSAPEARTGESDYVSPLTVLLNKDREEKLRVR